MPRPLYSRYPFDRRMGRPQSLLGRGGEDKKSPPLPGIESWSSSPYPSHYIDRPIPDPMYYMYVYHCHGQLDYRQTTPENNFSVAEPPSLVERKTPRQGPPNRYCACTNVMCNCCREFSLSVVPIKGPGKLNYVR